MSTDVDSIDSRTSLPSNKSKNDSRAAVCVVRQMHADDLEGLVKLAGQATFGLSTLPRDRKMLAARVKAAVQGFARLEEHPRGETYLFVLEDLESGEVVGTSGIVSKVGGFDPFYAYAIETSVHESKTLGVRKEISALHLVRDHDGPCEIGSLFLAPDHRHGGNGRLLSLSRFLFMAEHPELFDPVVIAEMRGITDENGRSPFWEAVGRHFFDVDFPTADYLSVVDKRFIAELMPEHPIYLPLLPLQAQEVVGKVHPRTEPAMKMLLDEGFEPANMVDIFDAGPAVTCPMTRVRSVRESEDAMIVEVVDVEPGEPGAAVYLIASTTHGFRACMGGLDRPRAEGVRVSRRVAAAIEAAPGERVRFVTLRPER